MATTIINNRKSDGTGEIDTDSAPKHELHECAEALIKAIHAKDVDAVVQCLSQFHKPEVIDR